MFALPMLAAALAVAGWSAGAGGAGPAVAGPPASTGGQSKSGPPKIAKRAKLRLLKTRYGRILTDGDHYALYLFTRDAGAGSECGGACARAWPPFKTRREPRAGKGLDEEQLGTTRRHNGDKQVTYAGHPLYYYEHDREPGDVLCQDVEEFGGHWYVVGRDGTAIR